MIKQYFIFLFLLLYNCFHLNSQEVIVDFSNEVLVTSEDKGGLLKCEPSAAIFEDTILIAWNDSHGGETGSKFGVCVGWAISIDFGKTFQFGGYLSNSEDEEIKDGADSWLSTDSQGNFYLILLNNYHLNLYKMNKDNLGFWNEVKNPLFDDYSIDKPFMHIDKKDNIWISFTQIDEYQTIGLYKYSPVDELWEIKVNASESSLKIRGSSSISTSGDNVIVTWHEGDQSIQDELWSTILSKDLQVRKEAKLIYKPKASYVNTPVGYSMGFDHEESQGRVRMINPTWLNSIGESVNLVIIERLKNHSNLLFFELDNNSLNWGKPQTIHPFRTKKKGFKMLVSNGSIDGHPAFLYYDRRTCGESDCPITNVYLSLRNVKSDWLDYKVNSVSSDWSKSPGDEQFAPIQKNFGDYITLASHKNKAIAVWTDGRNNKPQIYSRAITLKH